MLRGVDLMARHSGPALRAVAWLTLSLAGLGLTLVATVRAIDRTTAVSGPSVRQLVQGTREPPVHGTGAGSGRSFPSENTENSGRTKHGRLGPGDLLLVVSEDFAGGDHRFSVRARLSGVADTGAVAGGGSSCAAGWAVLSGRGLGAVCAAGETAESGVGSVCSGGECVSGVELPARRLFQLPRLSLERPVAVLSECELAGEAFGVGIYSEAAAVESAAAVRARLADFLSGGWLAAVEAVLGPILDVDSSGGLTVVVGHLDPAGESGEYPLWG
ncbi:MAG: hypothetical protein ACKPHU_29140, partial [Planctomycetaceae bacterium]